MTALPRPPSAFTRFVKRFPEIGEAWNLLARGGEHGGPLDKRTQRLLKLGIAIGALREGPTHSAVRKGFATGISLEEMEQVVALAASTIGLPSAVAVHGWVLEEHEKQSAAD